MKKNNKEIFRMNEHFDVLYLDGFFNVKSKGYDFSIGQATKNEKLIALLKEKKFKGDIHFDLLMANGLNEANRFASIYFDGEMFDLKLCRIIRKLNIDHQNAFYSQDVPHSTLCHSILTDREILRIQKCHY